MRIYPGTTVDYEFATLGGLGYTGTLNDRQFAALRAEGLTGSLADMFKQFDGTLGGGSPTLSEQVQAILAGTTGFALDPSDLTTMWQDTGTVTPVATLADPVGHIQSKWGTTARDFIQGTAGARPAWDGTAGMTFDGADDWLSIAASSIFQNVPAVFASLSFICTSFAATPKPLFFSTNATGNPRLEFSLTGNARTYGRILDAGEATLITGVAALSTGTRYTLTGQINDAGDKAMQQWVNGVSDATGTNGGTLGNTSNTAAARVNIGAGNAGAQFLPGKIGRIVACPFIPSAGQRATIEAWINEVAL